jgi:hypothetical protein
MHEDQQISQTFEDSPVKTLKNEKRAALRQIYGASTNSGTHNDLARTQASFGKLGLK